jgi:hypothetical protein
MTKMIDEIKNELNEGFERELFIAAQKNLEDKSNPLRLNNYSYAMRELTRHVLHRLSPDENVNKCLWYKNEKGKKNGITRMQRALYAVQGGLDNPYVEKTLGLDVNKIHRKLIEAIDKLSKFTHIEPQVFNLPEVEVDKSVNETNDAVFDFLSTFRNCRKLIIDQLWEHIGSAVINEALSETIQSIDSFTSHHYIDEVYTNEVKILSIDHEFIYFRATGKIDCELQWGSNSDLKNDNGATLSESFSFTCDLFSPVTEPEAVETKEDSLGIDTRAWEEARYDLDEIEAKEE